MSSSSLFTYKYTKGHDSAMLHQRNFSWYHPAYHMMVILLIYSYHMIDKMATQETNNTDEKGNALVHLFIVHEFLVVVKSLYTVTKGRSFQVS